MSIEKNIDIDIDIDKIRQEDEELGKFLSKTILMGINVKAIDTKCGRKYYIASIDTHNHIIYIPKAVRVIEVTRGNFRKYTEEIKRLRGVVKVQGGEDLFALDNVFANCELDVLDLRKLKPTGYVSLQGLFEYSKIKEIIFSDFEWKVSNLTRTFLGGEFGDLNLNNWKVNTVTDLNCTFYETKAKSIKLNKWEMNRLSCLFCTFKRLQVNTLDLRNINLNKARMIDSMFNGHNIKRILLSKEDQQEVKKGRWHV